MSGALQESHGVNRAEWIGFAFLLAVCNAHLIHGAFPASVALLPSRVLGGELWRLFSHAFAHLSWYHLAVDGLGFATLYAALSEWPLRRRLSAVITCILGSALAALTDPRIDKIGLCGLSGCAHGLMVLVAIDAMRASSRPQRSYGWIAFSVVLLKCFVETLTGGAVLAEWHLGSVGIPLVICHAGGALAALLFAVGTHLSAGRTFFGRVPRD